ncbi:MAG TPA: hypothetical protein VK168_13625 [Saprospiraceae bacterium]|nr:hypothetical protein [Saprospiraceae bacterium]
MVKRNVVFILFLFSRLASSQEILDIGLFKVASDSSLLEVRIRPSESVVQGAYTAGVFTIRHLASYGATISAPTALNNPLFRYSLVNQGTDGAYKYYSFSFVSPFTVNWTANVEYPIARVKLMADCQQSNAFFEIINNAWTLANNGNVYQELNGLESQDSIYQSSVTTNLGGTILDTIPPSVTCTANKQVVCDTNLCSYTHLGISWNAAGSDNCSGVILTYYLTGATLDTLSSLDQAFFQTGLTDIMVVGVDGAGMSDTCMFQVSVSDAQAPVLTAPVNITVIPNIATCSAEGVTLGNAIVSDNCPGVQVTHNAPAIFPSGSTVVQWTATDGAGLTTTATQTVTVQTSLTVTGIQASRDTICSGDSVSVTFLLQGGTGPYTILYKANNSTITLSGYEANTPVWHQPVVTTFYKIERVTDALGCEVFPVSMEDTVQIRPPAILYGVTATPAQTCFGEPVVITALALRPGQSMTFGYTLEPGGGPMFITGMSAADGTFSFPAPNQLPGTYTLTISTIELNGCTEFFAGFNSAEFTVLPNPTVGGIAMVDSSICTGLTAEVVAFGVPPDVQATFIYTINGVPGADTVQTITTGTAMFIASEFPEGDYTVVLSQVIVAGCTTNVQFSTNFAVDPFDEDCGLAIGGRVITENGTGVEEARITLAGFGPHGPFGEIDFTDTTGAYRFLQSVPVGSSYTITPFKNDNPLNGVTTYDLVLISKHILGLERLSTPYRMIAADANKSGSITTFDIVEIRKLILGIYQVLPNNNSWRFVDKAYVFPDTLNPFTQPIPEHIMESAIQSNALAEDFIGVKVGDVNGTAIPNVTASLSDRHSFQDSPIELHILGPDRVLYPGEQVTLTFDFKEELLEGFQFTLEWKDLDLLDVHAADQLYVAHFDQAITGSWISVEQTPEVPSFSLTFQVKAAGNLKDMLRLSDAITPSIAFRVDNHGAPADLAFHWLHADEMILNLKGSPNPFSDFTELSYYLPKSDEVTLTIRDELGRVVYRQSEMQDSGWHVQLLDERVCPSAGWYVCTLFAGAERRQLRVLRMK